MISTLVFDEETCERYGLDPSVEPRPYQNCLVLGLVCDAEGKKESKSKGNYTSPNLVLRGRTELDVRPDPAMKRGTVGLKADQVRSLALGANELVTVSISEKPDANALSGPAVAADVGPKDTIHLHPDDMVAIGLPRKGGRGWFRIPIEPPGADAFRWLFIAANPAWSNTRLSLRAIRDRQREFLLRLRNVYQFFAIYADIAAEKGNFDPAKGPPRAVADRDELDRWIVDRLHHTIGGVTEHMEAYLLYDAAELMSAFVDDLSNWYVRRSRSRFWEVKPDFKVLGPRLGKGVKECAGKLAGMDRARVKAALDGDGLTLELSTGLVTLGPDDVVVTVLKKEGYEAAAAPEAVVALETELDDDLRAEGLVRELVNRVQGLRKELDLGYTQRIALRIDADGALADALRKHGAYLEGETLTTSLEIESPSGDGWAVRDWDVEGHAVTAGLRAV